MIVNYILWSILLVAIVTNGICIYKLNKKSDEVDEMILKLKEAQEEMHRVKKQYMIANKNLGL